MNKIGNSSGSGSGRGNPPRSSYTKINDNNDNNDDRNNNVDYTDYISSRHSSSFEGIDDNSATLPRSNMSNTFQHGGCGRGRRVISKHLSLDDYTSYNNTTNPGSNNNNPAAIVELSSLFRSESSLFRNEKDANEAESLLVERERRKRRSDGKKGRDEEGSEEDEEDGGDEGSDDEEGLSASARRKKGRRRRGRGRQRSSSSGNNNDYDDNGNEGEDKQKKRGKDKTTAVAATSSSPASPPQAARQETESTTLLTSASLNSIINNKPSPPTIKQRSSSMMMGSKMNTHLGGGGKRLWGSFLLEGLNTSTMTSPLGSIREEGSDNDEEDEDPIMEVMDYLEDEIDEHTYDELIPLQIRMALEDQVFGWDHFFSNILGHVGFTVGSYLLTFWIITFVVLHEVPWGTNNHDGIDEGLDDATNMATRSNNPWGMPHELFSFVRTALSVGSAISTFRTIRRRRRVWLRQPYGSVDAGDSREARRRQSSLEEADRRARRFVLGSKLWAKMQRSYTKRRNRYLARGVNRKLMKAQKMFERRHRNRVKLIRSTSASSLIDDGIKGKGGGGGSYSSTGKKRAVASALTRHGHESSHHERVRMLASTPTGGGSVRKRLDSFDNASLDSGGGGSLISHASATEDHPSITRDSYHGFVSAPMSQYAMDSHTLPNFAMESVSHDQMPFAHGEIKKIPYVHGGFFGAAPFMLTNPHWIAILRILMPDVYVEISRRASYAPAPRLIHWAENNPVVAAYGTAHEIEFSGRVPTLEWDVFLDPYLVRRVEIVLSEKEAFLQRQKDSRKKPRVSKSGETSSNNSGAANGEGGDNDGDDDSGKSTAPQSSPISAADERLVLSYYDKEIKRRTTILVERMLIAHGNIAQLMMEQTGYLKKYNFSRVKRTRKTLGGGIFARQWLAVYSEAMKLGMGYEDDDDDDTVSDSGTDGSFEEREDIDFANFSEMKDDDYDGGADHGRRDIISPDSKSMTAQSLDAEMFRSPHSSHGNRGSSLGPPRKIVMMRSNDEGSEDGMSTDGDGSINSEPSLKKTDHNSTPKMGAYSSGRKRRGRRTPTLERVDATSLHKASVCPDKSMSESISVLKPIMQCSAPFGLVLDMKSRHVSRRVWALVIDYLRDAGARVEGIASFIVEEVRDITQYCSSSVNEIVFIHSAGDLQHGCHTGQIKRGDRVFFNAGSLLWDYPNLYDADVVKKILWHRLQPCFDEQGIKEGYRLKPYAMIIKSSRTSPTKLQTPSESESEACDESTLDDGDSTTSDLFARLLIADTKKRSLSEMDFVYEEAPDGICSTIQQYKDYYQLSIGLYVQEFAIDEVAISLIVKYVNSNLHVYDLGLSWGGINGLTVKGIQPGRFTATDGLWNQRYGGMPWKKELGPGCTVNTE